MKRTASQAGKIKPLSHSCNLQFWFLFIFSLLFSGKTLAQAGCTDPNATNYNPNATTNNGSCTYNSTSYTLTNPRQLPAALNENSGLIYTDGQLWTLNDGGNAAAIYRISETDGSILQTVNISNATNTDWEAITADENYMYIGDFGNNENGNRTNLKIYRLNKADLGTATVASIAADEINFTYEDQVIQHPVTTGPNQTAFDCEAFLVKDNQLHLFTKDWLSSQTKHYILPAMPGTYVARLQETFNAQGLITGSAISTTNKNEIVLIGYSADLTSLFMWLLFDYTGENFFSGNKRRVSLGSAAQGQIEGVTFTKDGTGYIASEQINRTVFGFPVVIPPRLYTFSTATWVPLPIGLLYFKARQSAGEVKLTWQTATETNNAYFTVERATNALDFKKLGEQKGAGNSQIMQDYTFTDHNPQPGTNYYRLKQTDYNGTFTYSPILAVKANVPQPEWQISPVPVQNGKPIIIQFNNKPVPNTIISLVGLDGKSYANREIINRTNQAEIVSTKHLKPGVYLLKLRSIYYKLLKL